jgi:hypothetical protein
MSSGITPNEFDDAEFALEELEGRFGKSPFFHVLKTFVGRTKGLIEKMTGDVELHDGRASSKHNVPKEVLERREQLLSEVQEAGRAAIYFYAKGTWNNITDKRCNPRAIAQPNLQLGYGAWMASSTLGLSNDDIDARLPHECTSVMTTLPIIRMRNRERDEIIPQPDPVTNLPRIDNRGLSLVIESMPMCEYTGNTGDMTPAHKLIYSIVGNAANPYRGANGHFSGCLVLPERLMINVLKHLPDDPQFLRLLFARMLPSEMQDVEKRLPPKEKIIVLPQISSKDPWVRNASGGIIAPCEGAQIIE